MYFIKKGAVSYIIPEDIRPAFLIIGKGNYFGEIDMIFAQERKFTVVAHGEVELLELDRLDYQKVVVHS